MDHPAPVRRRLLAFLVFALAALVPRAGAADALTGYTVQAIAQLGQKAGEFAPQDYFDVGQLNENGQLVFGTSLAGRTALIQLADGKFTPILVEGGPSPGGKTWPAGTGFAVPVSMNDAGNVAFVPVDRSSVPLGIYLWDFKAQSATALATPGTPAVDNLMFAGGGAPGTAWINNQGDVSFLAAVKGAGGATSTGAFVRHGDGQIRPVALPGDSLPGVGGREAMINDPGIINDTGLVAFDAWSTHDTSRRYSYLLGNGAVSVIADGGTEISGFGKVAGSFVLALSNNDRSVLIGVKGPVAGTRALFLWNDGQFTPVLVAGQEMPGGGTLYPGDELPPDGGFQNEAGQYPFVVRVQESGHTNTALYIADAQGKLALVLKTGMSTELGTITAISSGGSFGIGLNRQGQIALAARINNEPEMLLLLTPKAP